MSRHIFLLLLLAMLSACSGLPKQVAQPALYDFGIASNNQQAVVQVKLGQIESAPGLDGHEMRYRLAYQDPSRVFAFNESRWAILPADLLAQRIQSSWVFSNDAQCSLNITLDVFDQVFDSATTSRGVVQLHAELVNIANRNAPRLSTVVKVEKSSASADAKGGVTALMAATDEAIAGLQKWTETQKCGESTP
jgi:hypothetical protein